MFDFCVGCLVCVGVSWSVECGVWSEVRPVGADWTWSCGSKFFTLHSSLFTFHTAKVRQFACTTKSRHPFLQIFTIHILLFYNVWYFLTLSLNSTPQSIIFCGFKQNMYHSTPQAHHVGAPQRAGDGRHARGTDGRYDMHARCGKGKKFTMWRCGCVNVHLFICSFLPISDSEGIKILII